jgi:hypothetical protein
MVNLQNSLGNYSLNFTAVAVLTVTNNNNNPTMWFLLNNIWLTVTRANLHEIVPLGNIPALQTALTQNVEGRIGTEYRTAANPLIANVGRFCSYCERSNPSPLAVEHMTPKDNYPLFALAWPNFLLTCTPCNIAGSGKGTNPQRATVAGWGGAPADELTYYTRIRAHYLWPDDQLAYQNCTPELQYWSITQNAWRPVPLQQSVRWGITITNTDYTNRRVTANIYLDGTATLYPRRVRIWMVTANQAATDAVNLFGLNRDGVGTGNNAPTSDGRMYDRTRAWFTIVGSLGVGSMIPVNNWQGWWSNIINHELSTIGFFSNWVKIIQTMNQNDPTAMLPTTLLARFLNDCDEAGQSGGGAAPTPTTSPPLAWPPCVER